MTSEPENKSTLKKMLENTNDGIREARRIRREGYETKITKALPENTVLQTEWGNILEPLPKKFGMRGIRASTSALQKSRGILRPASVTGVAGNARAEEETELEPTAAQPHIGTNTQSQAGGQVLTEEIIPANVYGQRQSPIAGGTAQNEQELIGITGQPTPARLPDKLNTEELYVSGLDQTHGQPPAKIPATPGRSGSSEVFRTNVGAIPDPTKSKKEETILKIRRMAGMAK